MNKTNIYFIYYKIFIHIILLNFILRETQREREKNSQQFPEYFVNNNDYRNCLFKFRHARHRLPLIFKTCFFFAIRSLHIIYQTVKIRLQKKNKINSLDTYIKKKMNSFSTV